MDQIEEAREQVKRRLATFPGALTLEMLLDVDAYGQAVLDGARGGCTECEEHPCHEDADGKTWCRSHVALRTQLRR